MTARLLIRDACLADGHSPTLQVGVSLLIEKGQIARVSAEELDPGDAQVLDGGGATIVPAFVDAHSHLTMPGGSHWIERGSDPPDALREVARRNAARLSQAGILWARDVGSPAGPDGRAISLQVRDELASNPGGGQGR
jgi:imidazolonepropionase-like amidohydrolase